ncbi:hypothetical protein [Chroococcidiopsis sp.]|uniref:hypothetical protein n=1 Tax=Chroococcidiopsis sp. TaxID=3088168 RepID=UPI003F2A9E09
MDFNLTAIEFQIASEVRVNSEGKAIFSLRSAAMLAGVSHMALSQAFSSGKLEPNKLAQFLMQQGFEGGKLKDWAINGIPDLAVGSIIEYYAFEAGRYNTETARLVFRAFARIGIRTYAHKLTGYDKVESSYEVSLQQLLEGQVPATPTKYSPKYHKAFWEALERCYGLKQGQRACSRFIACYIYGYLPVEVQVRLNEVNPTQEDGKRLHYQHQHLEDVMLQLVLNRIVVVTALLDAAENRKAFKKLVRRIPQIRFNRNNVKLLKGAN